MDILILFVFLAEMSSPFEMVHCFKRWPWADVAFRTTKVPGKIRRNSNRGGDSRRSASDGALAGRRDFEQTGLRRAFENGFDAEITVDQAFDFNVATVVGAPDESVVNNHLSKVQPLSGTAVKTTVDPCLNDGLHSDGHSRTTCVVMPSGEIEPRLPPTLGFAHRG